MGKKKKKAVPASGSDSLHAVAGGSVKAKQHRKGTTQASAEAGNGATNSDAQDLVGSTNADRDDLDELFGQLRQKKRLQQEKATAAATEPPAPAPTPAPAKVQGNKDDIFGEGPLKQRRYDEEGLPVYSTEELNVGRGGDTALCPFDCECCF